MLILTILLKHTANSSFVWASTHFPTSTGWCHGKGHLDKGKKNFVYVCIISEWKKNCKMYVSWSLPLPLISREDEFKTPFLYLLKGSVPSPVILWVCGYTYVCMCVHVHLWGDYNQCDFPDPNSSVRFCAGAFFSPTLHSHKCWTHS